jgi:ubiquinone/menaquinone biosynthesis C-methylase UbiE
MNDFHKLNVNRNRPGKGPSSFWMHDSERVFAAIGLCEGQRFLDLGCGPGDYSLAAAHIVGPSGWVYALDIWQAMVELLESETRSRKIENLTAMFADIASPLPFPNNAVDACLISTVLHMPKMTREIPSLSAEVHRVLAPGGCLAIIEVNRDSDTGPPKNLRLSPEGLESQLSAAGFLRKGLVDLGRTFLIHFEKPYTLKGE